MGNDSGGGPRRAQASRSACRRAFAALLLLVCVQTGAAEPRVLLVLGDSLSAGYGLAAGESWVDLLTQRLARERPGWRVVNASISGETSAGGAARIAGDLARHRPAVVVVELGANDGLRGLPVEATHANLERMLVSARGTGAKVLLIGMRMPPNYGPEYTQAFAAMFAELARGHADAFIPLLLEPIATERALFQDDNLHPTAAAQPRLLEHVWPVLAPLLDSAP